MAGLDETRLRGLGVVLPHIVRCLRTASALAVSPTIAALAKVFVIIDPPLERDVWCADLTSKHPM